MKNLRNIDLNLLVIFEAIYSTGNISQAAIQLGMSQPTISNALSRLRDTLDDPLFIRTKAGVTPTSKAEQIINPIRDALQTILSGIGDNGNFNPTKNPRKFKILISEAMEPIILPTLINQLPPHNLVSFDHINPMSLNMESGLHSGDIELGIFVLPPKLEDFRVKQLCPLDLICVTSDTHPRIAKLDHLSLEDYFNEGHVTLNFEPNILANTNKFHNVPAQIKRELQVPKRRVISRVSSADAIARMVGSTNLIGILPRQYAKHAALFYGLKIYEPPMELPEQNMHMIWHKKSDLDNGHIWLRERIQTIVNKQLNN